MYLKEKIFVQNKIFALLKRPLLWENKNSNFEIQNKKPSVPRRKIRLKHNSVSKRDKKVTKF